MVVSFVSGGHGIECDGCGSRPVVIMADRGKVRRAVRRDGWATRDGKDLCSACNPDLVPKQGPSWVLGYQVGGNKPKPVGAR